MLGCTWAASAAPTLANCTPGPTKLCPAGDSIFSPTGFEEMLPVDPTEQQPTGSYSWMMPPAQARVSGFLTGPFQ
ncbi:hypothetical protein GW7_03222 [Heterocephalus glaber]|uniref:Uncharacterized protein n=1 Tax=Heterocephalus glaber TaxID=10181 RepID=G5B4V5_HETGA|nr:hypothetical protein GW7_03222 [Heterocephalus glaber]